MTAQINDTTVLNLDQHIYYYPRRSHGGMYDGVSRHMLSTYVQYTGQLHMLSSLSDWALLHHALYTETKLEFLSCFIYLWSYG